MGIFDNYQFNPQSFGGAQGGLLEMLMGLQQQPNGGIMQQPTGIPGSGPDAPTSQYAMGDTQVPLFGQPQATDMSAQSRQPQMAPQPTPQMQQPEAPGGLRAGFEGFMNNLHNGPIGAVMGALGGAAGMDGSTNVTVKALMAKGLDLDTAKAAARNPTLMAAIVPQLFGTKDQTNDIKEYKFAREQGFKGTFEQWQSQKRAGAGEYSLTPVYGTDDQGNTVLIQPGKSGEAIQTKLPPGVKISSGVDKIDLGTQWGILDKKSGNIIGYQPKDIVGKESAEEVGKAQGLAKSALPQTKTAVESAVKVINDLRNHPGLEIGTGLSSTIDPRSWVPGQPGFDFQALNEQAQGKSFMVARESLKGAGQVTDFEGKKGEQAIANLKTAQSKGQYLKALDELERMLQASYADLQRKAGVASPAPNDGWNDVGNGIKIRRKQ